MNTEHLLAHLAIAVGTQDGPAAGIEVAERTLQGLAAGLIPDGREAREALTAWGLPWIPGKQRIRQMLGGCATLDVQLPTGWRIAAEASPHQYLVDAFGRQRLHWYLHGWDSIAASVCDRFRRDLCRGLPDPAVGAVHVRDGTHVVYTERFVYPHPEQRVWDADCDVWRMPLTSNPSPAVKEAWRANLRAEEDAEDRVRAWLSATFPQWRDPIRCWLEVGTPVERTSCPQGGYLLGK